MDNAIQQSRANDLAAMNWHNGCASIVVLQEMMTAFGAFHDESDALKGTNELAAADSRMARHQPTAIF